MCYASPGPRCQTHGKADFKKKQGAYDKAAKQAVATGFPEDMQKATKAEEAMQAAKLDMHATKGGLKDLSADIHSGEFAPFSKEYKEKVAVYNEALAVYTEKMRAYDKENGTVDGRQPSNHWRPKDRNKIIAELQEANGKLSAHKREMAANQSKVGLEDRQKKLETLTSNVEKLRNRFDHSRTTAMHVREGIIEAPKAPASTKAPAKTNAQKPKVSTATKTTPRPKAAANSKVPFKPVANKEEGWGTYVGGKYDRNRTNQQVASETRADIKQAVATGALPSEYKYKVTNSGNRITVAVIGDHSKHLNDNEHTLARYNRAGKDLSNDVGAYAKQYSFDLSNPQIDHFHSSHYINVEFRKEDGSYA